MASIAYVNGLKALSKLKSDFLKLMLDLKTKNFNPNSEGGWVFWCLLALAFGISFAIISIWGLLRLPNTPVINGAQWRDLLLEGSRSMDLLKTLRKKLVKRN